MTVPPDKLQIPRLKGRCPCGTEFAVTGPAAMGAAAGAPDPHVEPAPPPGRVAPPAPPAEAPVVRVRTRPVPWPRCADHPQVRSSSVCPACVKGYCDACVQRVQGGAICAACDGLCVPTESYGHKQETAHQRDRSMAADIGVIAGYPFRDALGFALLALFTWVFGYFAGFLAQGVLMMYTFHALTRVSNGDLKSSMPDFTDVFDLMLPARLAIAAFVISTGPLIAVTLFVPGAGVHGIFASAPSVAVVAHAAQHAPEAEHPPAEAAPRPDDEDDEASHAARARRRGDEDQEKTGGLAIGLLTLTLFWKLAYTPVALTVAALSRSYLSTLNPVIGIGTIGRMGATYWHAMVIYTVLALAQWALGYGLDKIPIAGALLRSFTDAYASLAIACTLGLAVFKKAKALGWD